MFLAVATKAPWWQSPNTGLAVAVFGIAITIGLWRLVAPRRMLFCWLSSSTAMVSSRRERVPDLQVIFRGETVADPYLVHLRMHNTSRLDIRSSDFDAGEPIIFDMGVPVLELLAASPNIDPELLGLPDDNKVSLKPMLIRSGDILAVDLLTDGAPKLRVRDSLADVRVRERSPIDRPGDRIISKVVTWVPVLFIVYYLVSDPVGAEHVVTRYHLGVVLSIVVPVALIISIARDRQLRSKIVKAYRNLRHQP